MKTAAMTSLPLARLPYLPVSLPREGAIDLELQEGIPFLRASRSVQERIEVLLQKQQDRTISAAEQDELERYAEIDDYLSLLNRETRNLYRESC
jgi:hypothetical protein